MKINIKILNDMMKNKKVLYENIMTSIAKEVKKVLNEEKLTASSYGMNNGKKSKVFEDYNNIDDVNIQSDTERWCDLIDEYLWDRSSADVAETLGLFATLVYLDQLADEEIKEIAEVIMNHINDDEDYDNPPVDEAFFEAVADRLKDNASDWCADVINEWKLNQ